MLVYACPYCKKPLMRVGLDAQLYCMTRECRDNGLVNTEFRQGLQYLHRYDQSWSQCLIEKWGWVEISKKRGVYTKSEHHYTLPYGSPEITAVYRHSRMHLDAMIGHEQLNGKRCLDLGAGLCWPDVYILKFHPRADIIALDVNDDDTIGLGRTLALQNYSNTRFVLVVGDMHNIPLLDNVVDVVYTVDALHHFRDLNQVMNEVYRVLKPGGKFYGLNEPDRAEGASEQDTTQALLENQYGIIERRPTLAEYEQAGKRLQLRAINDAANLQKNVVTHGLLLYGSKPNDVDIDAHS